MAAQDIIIALVLVAGVFGVLFLQNYKITELRLSTARWIV